MIWIAMGPMPINLVGGVQAVDRNSYLVVPNFAPTLVLPAKSQNQDSTSQAQPTIPGGVTGSLERSSIWAA